ncbi:MAG TPA: hypothetical protein VHF51_04550 [Solirubrobacteraceae bacterium]|jgi:hypothetical protein|nr:hypothetical protein [Solirubrobacteraceae bacterium]
MRPPLALMCLLAAVALGACGERSGASEAPAPRAAAEAARPALAAGPRRPGEIVLVGEASPATHGPYAFDGRYSVRFEQLAPEDPDLDFTAQTAFVAAANRAAGVTGPASVRLFRAAARTGRRSVVLRGRLHVDVTFGDFPYAIRFTPTDPR